MNIRFSRTLVIILISVFATGGVIAVYMSGFGPLHDLEGIVDNWRMRLGRKAPPHSSLVLIGIDRASYAGDIGDEEIREQPVLQQLRSSFPWSRTVWAQLIEQLATSGAKAIVLAMQFPGQKEGDDEFARVLLKFKDQVVIGSDFNRVDDDEGGISLQLSVPSASILHFQDVASLAADSRVGYLRVWPDPDEVVRTAVFRIPPEEVKKITGVEVPMESFVAKALRQVGRPDLIPDGYDAVRFRFTGLPGVGYRPYRLLQVLGRKSWQSNFNNGEYFRGKIVLVGGLANIFGATHRTPLGLPDMSGAELQANILGAALTNEFLRENSVLGNTLIIVLAGLAAGLVCLRMKQPVIRLWIIALGIVVMLILGQVLFDYANFIVIGVSPTLPPLLIGISALGYDFVIEKIERLKLRTTMGHYFSPRVLQDVLANPGSMQPRRAEVTLLLTDLRNSTPLAELLSVERLFELLNKVFEVETAAVMDEEGNLEHFLGDQFLSYWGAPQEQPDAVERAWRAACNLITAMERLKGTLDPEVKKLFGYGVALHRGPVLIGNKGSARRLDYGLVGDTVNTAARVESLTKRYGALCLVTKEIVSELKVVGPKRVVDKVRVEGKNMPVELIELQHPAANPNFAQLCAAYEAAYNEYSKGNFAVAHQAFADAANAFHDPVSQVLADRCKGYVAKPPDIWQGAWRADRK